MATLLLLWGRSEQSGGGDDLHVKFLVIGDWGRQGAFNQSLVAEAMAAKARAMGGVDFVISTGDNFYPSGLRCAGGGDDFRTSFLDIYHQPELQVPWHAVLGNHDYGQAEDPEEPQQGKEQKGEEEWQTRAQRSGDGGTGSSCYLSPLHELGIGVVKRDWRWHCQRSFQLSFGSGSGGSGPAHGRGAAAQRATTLAATADIFFIDTTPAIKSYYDTNWASNKGGLQQQSWQAQLRELETSLRRSRAAWKLVVGHHPVRSNHRAERDEVLPQLEPLLERYGVSAYFSGHDHNLQHIKNEGRPVHYLVSGAGSKIGDGFDAANDTAPLQYAGNGFVAVELKGEEMAAEFVGLGGLLHTARIPAGALPHLGA